MLSVTGLNHFYYVRNFTDLRCKHSRVLSIIRERLHREPCDEDVFIVMFQNRRIVRNPIKGMADDQKNRFIQYLAEQHQEDELTKRAMDLVLEDFMAEMKKLKNQMASMQSKQSDLENQLSEEHKLRKSAERKAKSLREKLDYARQEKFGDRRQRVMKKDKSGKPTPSEPDRQDEQDGYDGTDDTLRTDSVDKNESRNESARPQKERDLSNRPDGYKTMGVSGESIEHPSDLTKVPGRIIERRMVRVFSFRTFLTEECFEMVHYAEPGKKPKWGYFPSEGHPEVITKFEGTKATPEFLQAIAYEVYVKNVTFGLLHQWLTDMGMTISKNTLHNDGELPIDNNLAERTIRKLTTQRNNSLHYGSDAGAEMAATYHSVIGTVKLHGSSVWNFIGTFFKNIFNGCRDYVNMVSDKITLATGQC